MALAHLGQTFDLHGGGKDLIFPHHENEIAQSQGACGPGTFARYWLHAGFLNLDEEKMSKSVGNVLGVPAIVAQHSGEALRFFYYGTHYRSPLNLEIRSAADGTGFPGLEDAERRLDYFYATLARLDDFLGESKLDAGPVLPEAEALRGKIVAAMEDDFNSALTLAELGEAVKLANKLLDDGKSAPKDVRKRTLARLRHDIHEIGHQVLGFFNQPPRDYLLGRRDSLSRKKGIDQVWVDGQLAAREAARKGKDFAAADAIRQALRERGVEVMDTPRGAEWRVAD
jgi:cysteinyl-tRNA synthetase